MDIIQTKCINRISKKIQSSISTRRNSKLGITGCKYWQLMFILLYEYIKIHSNKILDCNTTDYNELVYLSNIYTQITTNGHILYRVVVENELISNMTNNSNDLDIVPIHNISDLPTQHIYCMCIYTNESVMRTKRKINQIFHFFTIIHEEDYWINSSYGSNYVCIPQYTTKLDINEFNDFCKAIRDRTESNKIISDFMGKYFLSYGIQKKDNDKKYKMIMPNNGKKKEIEIYTGMYTFNVGWIKNYENYVRDFLFKTPYTSHKNNSRKNKSRKSNTNKSHKKSPASFKKNLNKNKN
jgi:hypothetical protein